LLQANLNESEYISCWSFKAMDLLAGWVWLSIVGPMLAVKLFANVARALFVKYFWHGESLHGKVSAK
jgi:hypothetical protein